MASVHLHLLLQSSAWAPRPGSSVLLLFSHAGLAFQASHSPAGAQPGEFTPSGSVLYQQEMADSKHRSLKHHSHLITNSLNCCSGISLSKLTSLSCPAIPTLPCQCAPGKCSQGVCAREQNRNDAMGSCTQNKLLGSSPFLTGVLYSRLSPWCFLY